MLIGVYQGLFAAAAELGIADATRRRVQDRHGRGRLDGRYYCLTPILIGAWKRVT
jgi:hypothetical protein